MNRLFTLSYTTGSCGRRIRRTFHEKMSVMNQVLVSLVLIHVCASCFHVFLFRFLIFFLLFLDVVVRILLISVSQMIG